MNHGPARAYVSLTYVVVQRPDAVVAVDDEILVNCVGDGHGGRRAVVAARSVGGPIPAVARRVQSRVLASAGVGVAGCECPAVTEGAGGAPRGGGERARQELKGPWSPVKTSANRMFKSAWAL